jgi:uncharacterized protein YndB with AHSA1/START domain
MVLLSEFDGSASAVMDAPADDVFALITDVDRLPEWNAHIRRVLEPPSHRPLAPGAEWVVQMQVAGARWPSRATVMTCDASRRLFEHTSRTDDGNPSRAHWRWEITPIGDRRSRIDISWRGVPRTFWRRILFAKLRRRQLGDEVVASLRTLSALLTQPATTGG